MGRGVRPEVGALLPPMPHANVIHIYHLYPHYFHSKILRIYRNHSSATLMHPSIYYKQVVTTMSLHNINGDTNNPTPPRQNLKIANTYLGYPQITTFHLAYFMMMIFNSCCHIFRLLRLITWIEYPTSNCNV